MINKIKVLVVDKDFKFKRQLKDFENEFGHTLEFDTCNYLPVAKTLMQTNKYDVVITDYDLAPHTAKELVEWMRINEIRCRIYLVSKYNGNIKHLFQEYVNLIQMDKDIEAIRRKIYDEFVSVWNA